MAKEMNRPEITSCSNKDCANYINKTCAMGFSGAITGSHEKFKGDLTSIFNSTQTEIIFDQPAPKILGVVTSLVDNDAAYVGQTIHVDVVFSHALRFDEGELELTLSTPENAELVGKTQLNPNVARFSYQLSKDDSQLVFTAKYTDVFGIESNGTVELTVNASPVIPTCPVLKTLKLDKKVMDVNEEVTAKLEFESCEDVKELVAEKEEL